MKPLVTVMAIGFLLTSTVSATAAASTPSTQSVSQVVTIPTAPMSSFAGAAGGDGFNAAVADGRVYSVFHHQAQLQASCLQQSTGAACGAGWPYISAVSDGIGTPMSSYAFVAPDGDALYAYALLPDRSAGVMCITLPNPVSCGVTALTTVSNVAIPIEGEDEHGASAPYSLDFGAPARVGERIYSPFADSDRVWLSCFDLDAAAQCPGAPFELSEIGAGWQQDIYLRGPRAVAYGDRVYVTVHEGVDTPSSTRLTCWDPSTSQTCGDTTSAVWPVSVATPWGLIPTLSIDGDVTSVCLTESGVTRCVDAVSGVTVTAPTVLASFEAGTGDSGAFFGQARTIGSRMVFISSTSAPSPRFTCIDFDAVPAEWCGDFLPANANLLYAVDDDPDRPGCLWFNSDNGAGQIQSFDMLTMASGCEEQGRISRPQIAPDIESCPVYTWSSVQVLAPTTWETATVDVRTTQGERALPGGNELSLIDSITATSLADVDVTGQTSPLFVFSFTGATLTDGVTARFTWVTDDVDECDTGLPPHDDDSPPSGRGDLPPKNLAATGIDLHGAPALTLTLGVIGASLLLIGRSARRGQRQPTPIG